jgi:hypothetical protein
MNRRLAFRDVILVTEKVPDLRGIVLIGGQALNFWAERLAITSNDVDGLYGPALSDDIDFLGSAAAAQLFGQATNGKVAIATFDDANTPNTALVTLDIEGEQHLVDFLGQLQGFSTSEIEQVRRWAVPVSLKRGSPTPLAVMHPAHCLQSQLENVYGSRLNRRDEPGGERYVGRVRLAVESCRIITLETLNKQGAREALRIIEAVHEQTMLTSAMRARDLDGLMIEAGILVASNLPKEFNERRALQMREMREKAFAKYRVRKYPNSQG